MRKQIRMLFTVIALVGGLTAAAALVQASSPSAAGKMSNQHMLDRMNHMSAAGKAAMFDKLSGSEKMEAMKMAGHDMSKMSHHQRMEMLDRQTPDEKAGMFDKMPLDTRMATMREHSK